MLVWLFMTGPVLAQQSLLDQINRFLDMEKDIQILVGASVLRYPMDVAINQHKVDGATIVVIEDGVPVFTRGHYGFQDKAAGIPTDGSTLYQAASLTKLVASLGMVKAAGLAAPQTSITLGRKVAKVADANPSSLVGKWAAFRRLRPVNIGFLSQISVRRLLNNTAGLNRPTTGTECSKPSRTTGLDDILDAVGCSKCLSITAAPGISWKYSSGGYALAESMLLAQTGRSAEEFLTNEILNPYQMYKSTFQDGSDSMTHLAHGCNTSSCTCDVRYADVKFPGGLLALPLEYAKLLDLLIHDGKNNDGEQIISLNDIHEVMTPAEHINSTNLSCSRDSQCRKINGLLLRPNDICFANQCTLPLLTGDEENGGGENGNWYGLGVHMTTELLEDGYPRELFHLGGQDGFTTYFNIDRKLKNGIVIMINGPEGTDLFGRKALKNAIYAAFLRKYR